MREKKQKGRFRVRFLTILMILVLAAVGISIAVYSSAICGKGSVLKEAAKKSSDEPENLEEERQAAEERLKEQQESGKISYTSLQEEKDLDSVIRNEEDAYELLKELQYDLGISNVDKEYKYVYSNENEDCVVYTMQQYFEGVEVYGAELKMTADKSGTLQSITGEYESMESFSTDTAISEGEAREYLEKYLKSEYQYNLDEIGIESFGKKICIIDNTDPVLGYIFEVSDEEYGISIKRIFIDANTGEPVFDNSLLNKEMITLDSDDEDSLLKKPQGQRVVQTLDVWRSSDTEYELRDDSRNIIVGTASKKNIKESDQYELITWNPENESPNASGVDALANIERIYDYYQTNHDRSGLQGNDSSAELNVIVNVDKVDGDTFHDNAAMFGTEVIIVGKRSDTTKPEFSEDLNVMSHEYTHGIVNGTSNLTRVSLSYDVQTSVQYAISEGIADVFAEFIEDYMDDRSYNNSCNWLVGNDALRNVKNPDTGLLTDAKDFTAGTTDCHDGSTIISHAVYLMANGDSGIDGEILGTEALSDIWYNAIPFMTSTTDFQDIRKYIELQVLLGNTGGTAISDKQLECIIDSFDRVGVLHSYNYALTPESTLEVYDQNNELYDNYNIAVRKLCGDEVFTEDVHETSYRLSLDPGIYDVTFTDLENDNLTKTITLIVNDNDSNDKVEDYKDRDKIFTKFGGDERQVALVLDVSGSMDGTPLGETKSAAVEFVHTVLEESPNSKISIITYASGAETLVETSSNEAELSAAINGLSSGGGTNMHAAMSQAWEILASKKADKKLMFVMSDGVPNEGTSDGDDYNAPVVELADEIKSEGIIIYSLGFFHNLSGDELESGTNLMAEIASSGYHYNVNKTEDIQYVFSGIAYDVSGQNYILIRIECPVDVTVHHNGETLSSAEDSRNISTAFGILSFEGEEDEKKILRLREGENYEICINGTGNGTMDYTISYPDENGDYTDERCFRDIPITKDTVIVTTTENAGFTRMDQDTDGNGTFDQSYAAAKGTEGIEVMKILTVVAAVITILLILFIIIFKIRRMLKRRKEGKYCPNCGAPIDGKIQFCGVCGRQIQNNVSIKKSQPKWIRNLKLAVIAAGIIICVGITALQRSAAMTVLQQLKKNQIVSAQMIYENSVKDSKISQKYLTLLLEHYMDQIMESFGTGVVSKEAAEEIYLVIEEMNIEDVSSTAGEYIESMNVLKNIEEAEE